MGRTVGSNATDTRRRILDAAAEVFAEHGYSGASMRDIAERLGITKAALYYHFKSKDDLLDGLVQPVMEALSEFARDAEDGRFTTVQILRGFLDLTLAGVPGLFPLMIDQGAREAIKTRYDIHDTTRRIEAVLAAVAEGGGDGPERALRAQFALGGIRSMVLGRLFGALPAMSKADADSGTGEASGSGSGLSSGSSDAAAANSGCGPDRRASMAAAFAQVNDRGELLTDAECEVVVDSALAGLH